MKTRCGGGEERNVPALTYPIEFSETGRNCSDFVLRQRMCYCSQEDLLGVNHDARNKIESESGIIRGITKTWNIRI